MYAARVQYRLIMRQSKRNHANYVEAHVKFILVLNFSYGIYNIIICIVLQTSLTWDLLYTYNHIKIKINIYKTTY